MPEQSRKAAVGYFIRSALFYCMSFLFLSRLWLRLFIDKKEGMKAETVVRFLGQTDIFRALIYSAVFLFVGLLFFPRGSKKTSLRTRAAQRVVGAAIGLSPAAAFVTARPVNVASMPYVLVWLYVLINAVLLFFVDAQKIQKSRTGKWLRAAWPLSDLVFPALVWLRYQALAGRYLCLLRVFPAAMMTAATFLPWFFTPLPGETETRVDPRLQLILPGNFYQVAVDREGALLAVVSGESTVCRIDPRSPERLITFRDQDVKNFQAFALDENSRRLIYMNIQDSKARILDADTLRPLRLMDIRGTQKFAQPLGRTYWQPEERILYNVSDHGLTFFCPDGIHARSRYFVQPGDALFDNKRKEILYLGWFSGLMAFDADTNRPTRRLPLPKVVDRMTPDRRGDRVFISAPELSRILEVDLEDFSIRSKIPSLPGARVPLVDEVGRRLIVGSMAPFLEILSLDDFSLIRRLRVPAWVRWISLDEATNRIYMTFAMQGLWQMDLKSIDGPPGTAERIDSLFFESIGKTLVRLQKRYAVDPERIDVMGVHPTEALDREPCPDALWTKD